MRRQPRINRQTHNDYIATTNRKTTHYNTTPLRNEQCKNKFRSKALRKMKPTKNANPYKRLVSKTKASQTVL